MDPDLEYFFPVSLFYFDLLPLCPISAPTAGRESFPFSSLVLSFCTSPQHENFLRLDFFLIHDGSDFSWF